jgi:dipeptidyl aminopeptidase/acylaminoacyl peptidase
VTPVLRRLAFAAAVACGGMVGHMGAVASGGAPPPVADYLRPPAFSEPRLSPDGRHLVVSVPVGGRMNLAVVDLATRAAKAVTAVREFDVLDGTWATDETLVFSLGQADSPTGPGQYRGGGLFAVSRDGATHLQLSPSRHTGGRSVSFHARIPGSTTHALVAGRLRNEQALDLYRIDLATGALALVTVNRPDHVFAYVSDAQQVPRIALAQPPDSTVQTVWHRASADARWEVLLTVDAARDTFRPVAFLDPTSLLVQTTRGRGTAAFVRFDLATGTAGDTVAEHPRYDMPRDGVVRDAATAEVVGFELEAERPQSVWLRERDARTQAALDRALPDTINRFRRVPNAPTVLVTALSDREPTRYLLLDEEKRKLEDLFTSRPWIGPEHLVEMRPFVLTTRDGLAIPSYHVLPRDHRPGQRLPTVVYIHGGPHARPDTWGRGSGTTAAQILASRGYAVVLPNFRITPGLGSRVWNAGFGTLGRQMSDDHEDAARWALEQGFADPDRLCIAGASYGGYATLMALARAPELFKCGVAGLVVSDLEMQFTSTAGNLAWSPLGVAFWRRLVGMQRHDAALLRELSPVTHAARITGPLFLYAGSSDPVTPIEQTNAMVRALERAGRPPKELLVRTEEGHGFGKLEHRVELWERTLRFLDAQIGPSAPR